MTLESGVHAARMSARLASVSEDRAFGGNNHVISGFGHDPTMSALDALGYEHADWPLRHQPSQQEGPASCAVPGEP